MIDINAEMQLKMIELDFKMKFLQGGSTVINL